jgi:hypothetical protein
VTLRLTAEEAQAAQAAEADLDQALAGGTPDYHAPLAAWAKTHKYTHFGETVPEARNRWKLVFKATIAALTKRFLRRDEATVIAAPNSIPRAKSDGTLHESWGVGGGTSPDSAVTFSTSCTSDVVVGDCVRLTAAGAARKTDIRDYALMPAVGCVLSKPTSTTCVVQGGGLIYDVYTGLTPGRTYFLGADSRPTLTPTQTLPFFVQPIGVAITSSVLQLTGLTQLTRLT